MKYVIGNKIVEEEEKNEIEKRNLELLALARRTGNLEYLADVSFIIPYDLAVELSQRKGA